MNPDKYIKNYINGSLSPASSGAYLETLNPATGQAYAFFPDSQEEDLRQALDSAHRAAPDWARLDPEKRFRLLMRMADIIEQERDLLARAEARDCGKPFSMTVSADIPRSQACLRFYATAMLHRRSGNGRHYRKAVHYHLLQPMGVVAVSPHWNYPLLNLCEWIAPALAVGNCVVVHPSEYSPMTAYLLSKAAIDAGLPPGVLSVVHGRDNILQPLLAELGELDAIGFSGTVDKGREMARRCSERFLPLLLDTGGKNPALIFEDADFDQTVIGLLRSAFGNNGQSAYSTSRLYVARTIYEELRDEMVKRTQFLRIGDPFSKVTDLGALISRQHLEQVLSYISLSEMEGGKILCGGKTPNVPEELENGFFVRPALIEGLSIQTRTNQEEIFGPLATIAPFDTEEEAIALANQSLYQRAAAIWTRDGQRANRVASRLLCGQVWINDWQQLGRDTGHYLYGNSGNGPIGGEASLRFFTRQQTITQGY